MMRIHLPAAPLHRVIIAALIGASLVALVALLVTLYVQSDAGNHVTAAYSSERLSPVPEVAMTRPAPSKNENPAVPVVPPTTLLTRFFVHGQTGLAVEGAQVYVQREGRWIRIGATGEGGTLTANCENGLSGVMVLVRTAAYLPQQVAVPRGENEIIDITLSPGSTLSGVVVTGDSEPPRSSVRVIACPVSPPVSVDAVSDAMQGNGYTGFSLTDTDEGGRFVFTDLPPESSYLLLAGCEGHASERPIAARTGDVDVRLTLNTLYVALLRIRTGNDDSSAIATDRFMCGRFAYKSPRTAQGANLLQAVLAGIPSNIFDGVGTNDVRLLVVDSSGADRVGPFSGTAKYLGFRPLAVEFYADRWSGGIQYQDIVLVPEASSFGDLTITFPEIVDSKNSSTCELGFGYAKLVPRQNDSGKHTEYRIPIRNSAQGLGATCRVPCGLYALRVVSELGLFVYPESSAAEVEVLESGVQYAVSIDGTGTLELALSASDERAYDGKVHVVMTDTLSGARGEASFDRAPYVLACVPAGHYRIECSISNEVNSDSRVSWNEWTNPAPVECELVTPGKTVVGIPIEAHPK